MKMFAKIVFIFLGIIFLLYLFLPTPPFPKPSWDFLISQEPADQETPLRRGYYTNQTREQIVSQYRKGFAWGFNLNYPPEEGKTLIRDQTSSSYLEEVVHPFRESLFINGYLPKEDQEILSKEGKRYSQKVIIKFVGSPFIPRILIGLIAVALAWWLFSEWAKTVKWIFQ